jgi:hypothetical protein
MKKITTEYEGVYKETELDEILDFLWNMAEIAIDSDDFVRKVTYGITDETITISGEDVATLTNWYIQEYLKIGEQ